MNDKPPEEKVTKNTELEYESEVSNPAPPPEIPDDYEPKDLEEGLKLLRFRMDKKFTAGEAQELEKLEEDLAELRKMTEGIESLHKIVAEFRKNSN